LTSSSCDRQHCSQRTPKFNLQANKNTFSLSIFDNPCTQNPYFFLSSWASSLSEELLLESKGLDLIEIEKFSAKAFYVSWALATIHSSIRASRSILLQRQTSSMTDSK